MYFYNDPRDVPDQYLLCRAFAHAWEDFTPTRRTRADVDADLRCTRCTGTRHDVIGRASKRVWKRLYRLPHDYPRGLSRGDALMEVLRRYESMTKKNTSKRTLRVVEGSRL